jgi:hypothetical protein
MSGSRNEPYCFQIQGHIYYQNNKAFYPSVDKNPFYGHLFYSDAEEAADYRITVNL